MSQSMVVNKQFDPAKDKLLKHVSKRVCRTHQVGCKRCKNAETNACQRPAKCGNHMFVWRVGHHQYALQLRLYKKRAKVKAYVAYVQKQIKNANSFTSEISHDDENGMTSILITFRRD